MNNVIWKDDDEIIGNPDDIILAIKEEIPNYIEDKNFDYATSLIVLADILSADDFDKDDCLVRCSFISYIGDVWSVKELKEVE